jgi:nucleoporin NUP82
LIISPQSNFLAILTTHTIHVAKLPESSHLTARETGPLKLKTFHLGPTIHVTSQPALASALWHPLGVNGSCLVTVTEDAIVRVWELSLADRWSFSDPTLSIDLKKLADGTTVDQDFTATNGRQGFTPDSVEMEVASACFASRGSAGWSPMTLWVAMREGDVYALCPLLPGKWSPPPTLIPSLSVSIVSKVAVTEDDPQADRLLAQQQLAWMADLDNQDPTIVESSPGDPDAEVYSRPNQPGKVPKLQGPFEFQLAPEESEEELDGLLSDIFVIGPKIDSQELMFGEEDDLEFDEADQEGLSIGIVCLLTSSGRLHISLDIEGVEAQWLPKSKSKIPRRLLNDPTLLTFQVLDTLKSGEVWAGSWPTH